MPRNNVRIVRNFRTTTPVSDPAETVRGSHLTGRTTPANGGAAASRQVSSPNGSSRRPRGSWNR
ncbi:hypothetical protein GCM10010360_08800 [Streptomyces nogalater]